MKRIFCAGVALLALSACAPDFNPPPDYQGGFLMDSDRSRTITVEPSDTLYVISRRYDVPTRVIAARNGLMPPYTLTVGQTLILDPARTHKAQDGDTLTSIARRYGVDEATLASANDFPMGSQIRAGTDVWIPDPFTSAAGPVRMASNAVSNADLPPVTAAPRNTRPITSENLPPIPGAPPLSAGVSTGGIAAQPLSEPVTVQPSPPMPAPPAASAEVMTPAPQPLAPQPLAPQPTVAQPVPSALPPETNVASLPPQRPATPPSSTSGMQFTWPVNGAILARFGAAGKGLHNDGINIAAAAGTQVRAAGGGVVAYAGNELKGFGNLLLIKHADGWTTAYAHNDKLLVAKGDTVVQGQVIAVVGRTGNVDRPQLHFEVRKGTQALDPMAYLVK